MSHCCGDLPFVVQTIFLQKQQVNTDLSKGVRTVYIFDLTSLRHILCMSFDDHYTSSRGCIRGLIGSVEDIRILLVEVKLHQALVLS